MDGSARLSGDTCVGMSDAYIHQVEKLKEVLYSDSAPNVFRVLNLVSNMYESKIQDFKGMGNSFRTFWNPVGL